MLREYTNFPGKNSRAVSYMQKKIFIHTLFTILWLADMYVDTNLHTTRSYFLWSSCYSLLCVFATSICILNLFMIFDLLVFSLTTGSRTFNLKKKFTIYLLKLTTFSIYSTIKNGNYQVKVETTNFKLSLPYLWIQYIDIPNTFKKNLYFYCLKTYLNLLNIIYLWYKAVKIKTIQTKISLVLVEQNFCLEFRLISIIDSLFIILNQQHFFPTIRCNNSRTETLKTTSVSAQSISM